MKYPTMVEINEEIQFAVVIVGFSVILDLDSVFIMFLMVG